MEVIDILVTLGTLSALSVFFTVLLYLVGFGWALTGFFIVLFILFGSIKD